MLKAIIKYKWIISSGVIVLAVLAFYLQHVNQAIQPDNILSEKIGIQENDLVFGNDHAPLTVHIFFNYQSGMCRRFFNESFSHILKKYVENNQLRLILKPVDLHSHPDMLHALQTVVCIHKFGNLETLHELLLYNSAVVYSNEFKDLVNGYMYENNNVAECLINNNDYEYLRENLNLFHSLNTNALPTFVLNKKVFNGYHSHQTVSKILRKELKKMHHE